MSSMAVFGFTSSLILCLLLLIQFLRTSEGHRRVFGEHDGYYSRDVHLRSRVDQDRHDHRLDPELNVFFYHEDLKLGSKMLIYFPTKDPSTSPHLLSKHESDSIPFASSQLKNVLDLFSFPEGSKQALAMETTLQHCESPPIRGERKFCATSLESMLDSLRVIFGLDSKFKVLTTNYLSDKITPLQKYTISEAPTEVSAPKIVGCHTLPYPYAVFYCHGQVSDNKLYKVKLAGADGAEVEAIAMCHMDTSQWDPQHLAFRVLKTVPGARPVCHFFPADNLVWFPVPS